ncbi:hypothetical protein L3Y34_014203 [Caenorhabditis briggsae]|uniref:Uncharacterized protein n=1 Tax=Caenorhabditis briggsae TaxID=6238 RepID=A0AAE9DSA1_CAEBR|nr:hypothetical protein L3Y34_014203 [Caenorhabditis briggsae]
MVKLLTSSECTFQCFQIEPRKSIRPRSTSIWQVVSSLDGYTVRKLKDFVQSLIGKRQFGNMVHDLFMETVARIPFEMHAYPAAKEHRIRVLQLCIRPAYVYFERPQRKRQGDEKTTGHWYCCVAKRQIQKGEFIATFVGTLCGPLTANGLKAGTINVRYSYTATNKNSIKQVTKLLKSKEYVRYLRKAYHSDMIIDRERQLHAVLQLQLPTKLNNCEGLFWKSTCIDSCRVDSTVASNRDIVANKDELSKEVNNFIETRGGRKVFQQIVRERAIQFLKNKSESDIAWTYEHVVEIENGIRLLLEQDEESDSDYDDF